MKVLVYDPYVDEKTISDLWGEKISDLNEGLKILDIISLCVPLNKDTKDMISFGELSLMKKSAILINAARGGVVNENDLNKALNEKLISFAGIDVFEKEPPDKDNPLLKNKRVVLSPHAATFTKECLEKMSEETVQNIIDFFEKKIASTKIVKL